MQLDINNLTIRRGQRNILENITFQINSGEALALLGANGSGKSTLLRAMAGLLPIHEGMITLHHRTLSRTVQNKAESVQNVLDSSFIHYAGHQDPLKPALSVIENLSFWQTWLGAHKNTQDLTAAMTAFDLLPLADTPARFLSQGQRRRTALARLLVTHRPLWLLDEPTAALDTASQDLLFKAIENHRTQGGIVIIATHFDLRLNQLHKLVLS